MTTKDSRALFWALALLPVPLVTWGLAIFLSDDLRLLKGDATIAFGVSFPVLLTVAAGVATHRSWWEAVAGGAASVLALFVFAALVFVLFVPEGTFQ